MATSASKSRLLYEFRERVAGVRVRYVAGACLAVRRTIPWGPVAGLLQATLGLGEADAPERLADALPGARILLCAT